MKRPQPNDNLPSRIFLVGPMGVGKTTIGLQLAQLLGYRFVDSDKVIEERTGASIPLIFELEGEEGFRQRESAAIDELSQIDQVVLATGGGAVTRDINCQHLRQRGVVVYLHADLEHLYERTAKDRNRPLLQTENPKEKIAEIFQVREPLYLKVAHIQLDTGGHNVKETVRRLLNDLRSHKSLSA